MIGVNAVTRALERDQLRTVLVDRGTDPRVLVNHLLTLAATRDCPILLLNGLATTLASHLQVSSLIAIGFKVRWWCFMIHRDKQGFENEITMIKKSAFNLK